MRPAADGTDVAVAEGPMDAPKADAPRLDAPGTVAARQPEATANDCILSVDFRATGNSANYRTHGWSGQEADRVWSVGGECGLRIPVAPTTTECVLELEVSPAISPPLIRAQILRVRVNNRVVGHGVLTQRSRVRCRIEASDIAQADGVLQITVEHPGYYTPCWAHATSDDRPLAISFFSISLFARGGVDFVVGNRLWARPMLVLTPLEPSRPGTAAAAAPVVRYGFGHRQSKDVTFGEGWSTPEPAYTWTAARVCHLSLPAPSGRGPHYLSTRFNALVSDKAIACQRVLVVLNEVVIGQFSATREACIAFFIPPELMGKQATLSIKLLLPDAARPLDVGMSSDSRMLAIAVKWMEVGPAGSALAPLASCRPDDARLPVAASSAVAQATGQALEGAIESATGSSAAAILRGFESLGENCEFGIVQRKIGLEVLGLLRFGFTPLASLFTALDDDFAEIDKAGGIVLKPSSNDKEFSLEIPKYGLRSHGFTTKEVPRLEAAFANNVTRLGYLRRKFYEGLRASRKIYVIKRTPNLTLPEVLPLFQVLNRFGQNSLLYLTAGHPKIPAGTVELLMPGLMRGYLSKFAPYENVPNVSPEDWLRVCASAYLLDRQYRNAAARDAAASQSAASGDAKSATKSPQPLAHGEAL